jgi:chemotaxis protein MotA
MNISSLLGFTIATMILWVGVISPSAKPQMFLDHHALLLVVGGTLSAALIAFPMRRIYEMVNMFLFGVILKRPWNRRQIIEEMVAVSEMAQTEPHFLTSVPASHPFLAEGLRLIGEGILTETELQDVLNRRSSFFKRQYLSDAKLLNTLAKFPPAFGLLGASTGMIAMMTNLGKGGQETIGPAMAIALVATFWGIALANFVLLPMADYATRLASEDALVRQIILDGLMMLKRRENAYVIAEKLNGYLVIGKRLRITKFPRDPGAQPIVSVQKRDKKRGHG